MDKLNQVAEKNNKLEKYCSLKGNFWSERDYDKNLFNDENWTFIHSKDDNFSFIKNQIPKQFDRF